MEPKSLDCKLHPQFDFAFNLQEVNTSAAPRTELAAAWSRPDRYDIARGEPLSLRFLSRDVPRAPRLAHPVTLLGRLNKMDCQSGVPNSNFIEHLMTSSLCAHIWDLGPHICKCRRVETTSAPDGPSHGGIFSGERMQLFNEVPREDHV